MREDKMVNTSILPSLLRPVKLMSVLGHGHGLVLPRLTTTLSVSPATSVAMVDSTPPTSLLLLCGKSSAENDIAISLKSNHALNEHCIVRLFPDCQNPPKESAFDVNFYMNSLSTARFGRLLMWSPRINSTHDVVSQNFGELPIGSVCVADIQTKGRGRSSNLWESPEGCLLYSYTIQMEDGRILPLLQYVVCLAITEAIKHVCLTKGLPLLDVRIKWPNDLYLNGLKVGGILCTSTYKSNKFNISAGIGLNINNNEPTTCLNACLRQLTSLTRQLQREELVATFFNKFEELFDVFILQGFQPLEELYYKTWLHSGQRVIVKDTAEGQSVDNAVTIQGLTSTGYLLAISDDGQTFELHPDGNSFDFFKGLVRRKLN